MGTFFQAFFQADPFGKLIFFALFFLSCLSWLVLIRKIVRIRATKREAYRFRSEVISNKEKLLNLSTDEQNPFLHPFSHLYKILREKTGEILEKNRFFSTSTPKQNYLSKADVDAIASHLQIAIVKERDILEKNLFVLYMTTKLAPFLGLLGTVWGILITFGEMQAGHSVSSNTIVLGGLSTALTTTVLGLLIAIPALIAYSYIKNLSRHFASEMRDFSHFLLSTVELQYRKVDI